MKRSVIFLLLTFSLLTSCSPARPTAVPKTITVQYTAASGPWLADVYNCVGRNLVTAELRATDSIDINKSDLAIRIGQPDNQTSPAYQIGTDDILVVVNRQNPINRLTAGQVHGLFTGRIQTWKDINRTESPVQVWVFAPSEDVQQIFEQIALGGSPVVSTARLAAGPDEMSQAIANDVNAVGILSRHWKMGNVSEVFMAVTVPVLAITPSEPQGAVADLLTCLQK